MGKAGSPGEKRGASVMSWWRHVRKWFANAGIRILNPPGCCVPSLRHLDLVPDFARRLAAKLGLPLLMPLKSRGQSTAENAAKPFSPVSNLDGAFVITPPLMPGPALLVDDIVDSAWTLTVLTALLRQAGCPTVYPLALASTSVKLMNLSANAQATLLLTSDFLARRRVSINLLVIVNGGSLHYG